MHYAKRYSEETLLYVVVCSNYIYVVPGGDLRYATGVPHTVTVDDVHDGQYIPKGSVIIPSIW